MINLCLESTSLLEKVKGESTTLLVEKAINVLGDRNEQAVTMPLSEKKLSTKDVDKATGELQDMKETVVTICRKSLDKFEGRYKGYT